MDVVGVAIFHYDVFHHMSCTSKKLGTSTILTVLSCPSSEHPAVEAASRRTLYIFFVLLSTEHTSV